MDLVLVKQRCPSRRRSLHPPPLALSRSVFAPVGQSISSPVLYRGEPRRSLSLGNAGGRRRRAFLFYSFYFYFILLGSERLVSARFANRFAPEEPVPGTKPAAREEEEGRKRQVTPQPNVKEKKQTLRNLLQAIATNVLTFFFYSVSMLNCSLRLDQPCPISLGILEQVKKPQSSSFQHGSSSTSCAPGGEGGRPPSRLSA
ncbi:hypothetical protein LX32DRAFT_270553 [Colletotrichum zoysiae]|uniref:Transmembrane protein n=1 Tax=Colletotrichum zoysiae TaxID=1216348 RepID=A0AAD9LUP4_9PEZI|nr:hypothetical protein LX32DRAFT_270553 [Colletotrichum zoysiae]